MGDVWRRDDARGERQRWERAKRPEEMGRPDSIQHDSAVTIGGRSLGRRLDFIARLLFAALLLGVAVSFSLSCRLLGSSDPVPAASGFSLVAGAVSSPDWSDPGELGANELLGFSPAPRRPAAAALGLRVNKESGCAKSLPTGVQAGKTALRSLTSGELKRTYRLHLPTKASTTKPMPIVLNFHGRTATGIDQETYSGLVPISDRETFILVSPDGTGMPLGWSAGATPANAVDDVRFVTDLLDTLERELCIDTARVYATGFSNGAFMSSRLACTMPDRIAAIAVVGGVHYVPEGCPGRLPVLAIHGAQDGVVPMGGGTVRAWRYPGVPAAMDEWSATNGCLATTTNTELAPGVILQVYDSCAAATQLLVIDRAGHVWPGALGTSTAEPAGRVAGAELVWTFLAAAKHPS